MQRFDFPGIAVEILHQSKLQFEDANALASFMHSATCFNHSQAKGVSWSLDTLLIKIWVKLELLGLHKA